VPPSTRPSAIATPLVPASRPPSATETPLINVPSPATATPLVAANNPLRKQTLLGMAAPVLPQRSEPPAALPTPTPAVDNPLRKQTLLGIAPVIPEPRKAETAPAADPNPSVSSIVTPAMVATDAPTTSDVPQPPLVAAKPRSEPVRAAAALSISHDDLPELKPRRPRWQVPLAAAAVLALGVVGLRQLDHAPTPTPAELAHPIKAAKAGAMAGAKAPNATPKSDDDDDDGDDPNTGTDPTPDPTPPEPDPLKAKPGAQAKPVAPVAPQAADSAAASATPAAAAAAAATDGAAAAAAATPSGATLHINVDSDPPGARMFWRGKEVGTTPFVLELQPGEKHAYELGLPGFTTRKVVIDGSKTDITVGLRPDPTAPIGASHGK